MNFLVEIIAIGNELCYGKVQDTNSFWIADQITKLGGEVQRITCVKDGLEEIQKVFKEALEREPNLMVSTGGLGPTSDDKTIEALATLVKRKVIVSEVALASISKERGMDLNNMPEHFIKMSRTIDGATCILNPIGVAPSSILKIGETTIIAIPGPPKEVKSIFTKKLVKIIENETSGKSLSQRIMVDMRESEVSPLVEHIMRIENGVYLKPLVSECDPNLGLPMEIIVFEKDNETCEEKMNKVIRLLRRLVIRKGKSILEYKSKD